MVARLAARKAAVKVVCLVAQTVALMADCSAELMVVETDVLTGMSMVSWSVAHWAVEWVAQKAALLADCLVEMMGACLAEWKAAKMDMMMVVRSVLLSVLSDIQ